MSTQIFSGPFGDFRRAHGTAGGNALTTAPTAIAFPDGATYAAVEGRNFSTAVVMQVLLCPFGVVLFTSDNLADAANCTDATATLQDGKASALTLNSMAAVAGNDFLYVGSKVPFRGAAVDVGNTNGTGSVLTVKYRKNDDTWADITATDGTANAGATLAQDGLVTWTVPTTWKRTSLRALGVAETIPHVKEELYWTRWEVSVALDSSVTMVGLLLLNQSTSYAELVTGRVAEFAVSKNVRGVAGLEWRTDAGTANGLCNVACPPGSQFA